MTAAETPARTPLDDPNLLLASNRTAMAFERTRMSVDNTLMAVVRTALSLISFGFTIYQFLAKLAPEHPRAQESARNFGAALIILGILALVLGLISDRASVRSLRRRRDALYQADLLAHPGVIRLSPTTIIALGLTVLGLVAIVSLFLRAGPLG